jgi:hypothetical protein
LNGNFGLDNIKEEFSGVFDLHVKGELKSKIEIYIQKFAE